MADPLIPASAGDIIEKVGLTVAAVVGLVYVLKWLSQTHLKALNERIETLERELGRKDEIIARREERIYDLQSDILARTESHAHDMKSVAMQMLANDKANREFLREHQTVVRDMLARVGSLRCVAPEYNPHPTPLPIQKPLPSVPETDRTTGRA